jgi:hypothetical protein
MAWFWTLHLNRETAKGALGASGEKFDEVIDEINRFTRENPGEAIVLQFRYLLGRTLRLPRTWAYIMDREYQE